MADGRGEHVAHLRFNDDVVIVTGAGNGLGRSHALELAARGARVVVNDLGVDSRGIPEEGRQPAAEVVDEIVTKGGNGIAHFGDVSTDQGSASLVEATLDHFGRVDVVINNAGTWWPASFDEMTNREFDALVATHLGGSFRVTRAAWPHLARSGTGRVVMTCSVGFLGAESVAHYAAAKGGIYGLTNSLALEGARNGIRVNGICPFARTRLLDTFETVDTAQVADTAQAMTMAANAPMDPNDVSQLVTWLAHKECAVTGVTFHVGFGVVAAYFMAIGRGFCDERVTAESIAANLDAIISREPHMVLTSAADVPPYVTRGGAR